MLVMVFKLTNPLHNYTVTLLEAHHLVVQLFVACVNHSVYVYVIRY